MTPLHQFGELLRQSLGQIPLGAVRILFLAILAGLLWWVLSLPKAQVQPTNRKSIGVADNLKLWAAVALIIQLLIYTFI